MSCALRGWGWGTLAHSVYLQPLLSGDLFPCPPPISAYSAKFSTQEWQRAGQRADSLTHAWLRALVPPQPFTGIPFPRFLTAAALVSPQPSLALALQWPPCSLSPALLPFHKA